MKDEFIGMPVFGEVVAPGGQVTRAQFLANLKEIYLEWLEAAGGEGGVLLFRPEMVVLDVLEMAGLDDEESRTVIFGRAELTQKVISE